MRVLKSFRACRRASALTAPAAAAAALGLLLGFGPSAFGQNAAAGGARLTFPPGSTEIVVSGNVGAGSTKSYVLILSAGLNVADASTGRELSGAGRGTPDFKATVPAVSFGPGRVAAARSGRTPEGFPVQYLLGLGAGRRLLLDLSSDGDGIPLDVNKLDGNQGVFESPLSRRLPAAVAIPSDGSSLITLYPATGQNLTYRLDMVAPTITLPANPIYTAFPAPGHIVVVGQTAGSAGPGRKTVYSSIDNGSTCRKAVSPGAGASFGELADLPADGKTTGARGGTWTIRTGAAAPLVPDVVESREELAACLSDNELPEGAAPSGAFNGKPISQWIAKVQRDLSVPAVMLSASVSPDGQRLVVTFAGCHTSAVQPGPFTVFAVIDARGRVSYLHDQAGATAYFDGFTTSNSEGVYRFFGWLADGRTILINAVPFNLGAGGSCEPTYWVTYNADGQPTAAFQTVGDYALARGNSMLFYVGPGACQGALNQIHEVQTTTGKDTIVYAGPQDALIEISGASESPDGSVEVRYHVPGGKEQKVRVPR
jgi:hypothetical protein